jgi:hypothetical protein
MLEELHGLAKRIDRALEPRTAAGGGEAAGDAAAGGSDGEAAG